MVLNLLTIEYPRGLATEDLDEILAVLDRAGLDAEVRPAGGRRGGVGMEPWHVVLIASAASFLNALVQEAAKDTWKAIATIVRRVAQRRPAGRPVAHDGLVIEIRDRHLSFELSPDALDDPETLQRIAERLRA